MVVCCGSGWSYLSLSSLSFLDVWPNVFPYIQGDPARCSLCSCFSFPRDSGLQEVSEADGVLQITEQLLIFVHYFFFHLPRPIMSSPLFVSSLLLITSAVCWDIYFSLWFLFLEFLSHHCCSLLSEGSFCCFPSVFVILPPPLCLLFLFSFLLLLLPPLLLYIRSLYIALAILKLTL